MVRIEVRYEGELRCRAVHTPSGEQLVTDAPLDNHGKGQSFSPTDLVATAMGTCMATIMGLAAQARGIDLAGLTVSVEKEMTAVPTRRIRRLTTVIALPRDPGPEQRQLLERAAHACPVHASLHPEVERPITFRWGAG
jgi:putative redox protein